MSVENGKVCCNCRHCRRTRDTDGFVCYTDCDIDGHSIGYMECMTGWCRHWASDEKKWKEVEK